MVKAEEVFRAAIDLWPEYPGKAFFRTHEAVRLGRIPFASPSVDLGCGNGDFVSLFSGYFDIGVDNSVEKMGDAALSGAYGSLVQASIADLPFAAKSVSSLMSNSTLEHLLDLEGALQEIRRVLVPGGIFAFTVPLLEKRDALHFVNAAKASGDTALADEYARYFDKRWGHVNYLALEEWRLLLHRAGFGIAEIDPYESVHASLLADLMSTLRVQIDIQPDISDALRHLITREWANVAWRLVGPHFLNPLQGPWTSAMIVAQAV